MTTFGRYIADRRKELRLRQKDLAILIKRDDGTPISAQYLNDIEHDRRKAPPDYILKQLCAALHVPLDVLYFQADRLPPDLKRAGAPQKKIEAAYKAFRQALRSGGGRRV